MLFPEATVNTQLVVCLAVSPAGGPVGVPCAVLRVRACAGASGHGPQALWLRVPVPTRPPGKASDSPPELARVRPRPAAAQLLLDFQAKDHWAKCGVKRKPSTAPWLHDDELECSEAGVGLQLEILTQDVGS